MLVIEVLADVPMERGKHGAVLHVVAVDDRIEVGQIGIVAEIHEDTAGRIVLPVDHVAEIGLVALTAQDRVVDLRPFAVDPADDIGVLRQKAVEIDGDRTLLRAVIRQRVVGIFRPDIAVGSLLVLLFAYVILVEDLPQAIAAEGDDRRKYNDKNIGNGSSHTDTSLPPDILKNK